MTGPPVLLRRRQFLKLILITGGLVSCRKAAPVGAPLPDPATLSPTVPGATLQTPLAVDLRYVLEQDAVQYGPHAGGCEAVTIQGAVRDASDAGVAGLIVRVWGDDPARASVLQTDGQGGYATQVAGSLTDAAFHVQVLDSSGTTLLSDVIVAQAIPSCDLNLMTVNFVPRP